MIWGTGDFLAVLVRTIYAQTRGTDLLTHVTGVSKADSWSYESISIFP